MQSNKVTNETFEWRRIETITYCYSVVLNKVKWFITLQFYSDGTLRSQDDWPDDEYYNPTWEDQLLIDEYAEALCARVEEAGYE